MEGLEAAVIPFSQLERTARFDAEYFQHRFIESAALVEKLERSDVAALAAISDGNHFTISEDFVEDGIPYYRGQDVVGTFFIETASPNFITEEAFQRPYMKRSHLKKGDVLLSIVGTIGELSLVGTDAPQTCSCKLAILRPHSINAELLAVFLQSEHGRNQVERLTRGAIQKGLLLEDMDQLWVPSFGDKFSALVTKCVAASRLRLERMHSEQNAAERLLLSSLGLADWKPPESLSYIASSTKAFAAGRLDAQYFRPKFDEMHDRLKSIGGDLSMADALLLNARGRQPQYEETGLPVINSKHVRTNRVILGADNRFGIEEGAPIAIQKGDVLLNGTGVGTIGRAAPYMHAAKALPDNHVTVLRPKTIDPIYLSVFLNSQLGQMQIERFISGSSGQIELYPSDIAKIFVWDAPERVQLDIRGAILSAFDQERCAQDLLDRAKRAVEIAIEDSEVAALRYLEEAEA